MALFTYKALGKDGDVNTGEISAVDRMEALKVLDRRGLQPIKLSQSKVASSSGNVDEPKSGDAGVKAGAVASGRRDVEGLLRLKRAEVVLFTEELSEMLGAGLQLEPALKSMENREELGALKAVSSEVRKYVRDGGSFSVALKKTSPSFGPLYCSLAAAGEASGALDT
ncbi:MAG: type II secretion system F family protein, partial [Akkermansiaceae bacterium]